MDLLLLQLLLLFPFDVYLTCSSLLSMSELTHWILGKLILSENYEVIYLGVPLSNTVYVRTGLYEKLLPPVKNVALSYFVEAIAADASVCLVCC